MQNRMRRKERSSPVVRQLSSGARTRVRGARLPSHQIPSDDESPDASDNPGTGKQIRTDAKEQPDEEDRERQDSERRPADGEGEGAPRHVELGEEDLVRTPRQGREQEELDVQR